MSEINCYCAFCKHERAINTKKKLSVFNFLASGAFSLIIGFLVWGKLDPKILVILCGVVIVSEVFIKVRWRLNMVCPYCHFDPVLYLKDHKKAANRVKLRLEEYKNKVTKDPVSVTKKNPYRHLALKKLKGTSEVDSIQ